MSSTVVVFSLKFACADFDMFRPVILMVLFWRLHGRGGGGAISNALGNAEVVLQDGAVAEMTVSVTFGASVFGPQIDNFCNRSEYATFSILSATVVREMTVSVTFGALRFGLPAPLGRRPLVDNIFGAEGGGGFSTNGALISCWPGAMSNVLLRGASRTRMRIRT